MFGLPKIIMTIYIIMAIIILFFVKPIFICKVL